MGLDPTNKTHQITVAIVSTLAILFVVYDLAVTGSLSEAAFFFALPAAIIAPIFLGIAFVQYIQSSPLRNGVKVIAEVTDIIKDDFLLTYKIIARDSQHKDTTYVSQPLYYSSKLAELMKQFNEKDGELPKIFVYVNPKNTASYVMETKEFMSKGDRLQALVDAQHADSDTHSVRVRDKHRGG